MKMDKYILKVSEWETPATRYPIKKHGSAEIYRGHYEEGLYVMEGVGGYAFYQVLKPIPVTVLRIDGEDWMVDDPLHWIGMQLLAKHCRGRTLIGGLGLGLIVHALKSNDSVNVIDVYEINGDVIELIKPLLPDDSRVRIIEDDVFNADVDGYDTVILDIWRGEGSFDMLASMLGTWVYFNEKYSNAKVYIWGIGIPEFNPAVNAEARRVFLNNSSLIKRRGMVK